MGRFVAFLFLLCLEAAVEAGNPRRRPRYKQPGGKRRLEGTSGGDYFFDEPMLIHAGPVAMDNYDDDIFQLPALSGMSGSTGEAVPYGSYDLPMESYGPVGMYSMEPPKYDSSNDHYSLPIMDVPLYGDMGIDPYNYDYSISSMDFPMYDGMGIDPYNYDYSMMSFMDDSIYGDMGKDPYSYDYGVMEMYNKEPSKPDMYSMYDMDPYGYDYDYSYMSAMSFPESHDSCDCPCKEDNGNHYAYGKDDDHHKDDHIEILKEIGHVLPEIPNEISNFREELHGISMMISEWDTLEDLEQLMPPGISLKEILPSKTDYSIIGKRILELMEMMELEKMLEISESFFESDAIALISFHMIHYDGEVALIDYIIEKFQSSGLVEEFIKQFGEITWLRNMAKIVKELPWVKALTTGIGRIFGIEDYLERIESKAKEIEIERFGGCKENSVLRRCADESFASVDTIRKLQGFIAGDYSKFGTSQPSDHDAGVLVLGGCILSDTLCKEHSVEELVDHVRQNPKYEPVINCYSAAKDTCNFDMKTVDEYFKCFQKECEEKGIF